MATDPDRQSDGDSARSRRRALSELPAGIHTAFQVLWLLAVAVRVVAEGSELAHRPSAHAALSIVMVTSIWAGVAGVAWGLRVVALTGCGRWGERTRERVRAVGRRRRAW
jgi:hypothetical protein